MLIHNWAAVDAGRLAVVNEVDCVLGPLPDDVHLVLDSVVPRHYGPSAFDEPAVTLDLRGTGLPPNSPQALLEVRASQPCSHLMWLSGIVCSAVDLAFIWIYAHERRHVWQNTLYPDILNVNRFIATFFDLSFGQRPRQLDIPIELDAEIAAKSVLKTLRGEAGYTQLKSLKGGLPPEYHVDLSMLEDSSADWPGDVVEATKLKLEANGGQLKRILDCKHGRGSHRNVNASWLYEGTV